MASNTLVSVLAAALIQLLSVRLPLCLCDALVVYLAFVCSLSDIDHIRKQTPEQAQPGGVGVGHAGTSRHLRKQHQDRSRVLRSLKQRQEKKTLRFSTMKPDEASIS